MSPGGGYTVAGLFAGIGGIELGLHRAGHATELLCEIDPTAATVLRKRFPDVVLEPDITKLTSLPDVDVIAAGFPCQDLSQAGRTAGISGTRSGLVAKVFELIRNASRRPRWLVLENVPFMLQLDGGEAMRYVTEELDGLGYAWAYRVVDARAFGLPQRRLRVIMIASPSEDPRAVLFADEAGHPPSRDSVGKACGFYWTEGTRGLGWAVDAVPTLKGGSSVGIASPPAIWMADGRIVLPDISDAERLQGFRAGWTRVAGATTVKPVRIGVRWKLVGNAVSVPVSTWVGRRLARPGVPLDLPQRSLSELRAWPHAAWGRDGRSFAVEVSAWPVRSRYQHLHSFLKHSVTPLSARASEGFYSRAVKSRLRFPPGFLDAIASHLRSLGRQVKAA